jgi:hypothetical protein
MRRSTVVPGLLAGLLAGLLGVLLAGCVSGPARPHSVAVTAYPGLPSGLVVPSGPALPAAVAVLQPGGRLALAVWGSGSCPAVPVAVDVVGRHAIRITVDNHYQGACTADYTATTSIVQLDPTRVDTTAELTITLDGGGSQPSTLIARPAGR